MEETHHYAAGLHCPDCGLAEMRWWYWEGLEVYRLQCWACGWSMWEWHDHRDGGFRYEVMQIGDDKAELWGYRSAGEFS